MSVKSYIYIVQVTRQLSIDILNNFARQGENIQLITGVVESSYEPLDSRVRVTSFIKYDNSSKAGRMITGLLFTVFSFLYLIFSSRKKELILVTTPPFIIFLGSFFKKIRGQNYHLLIWDLYPDVLVNLGVVKENSFIPQKWIKWNTTCFNKASTVITLGKYLADAIKKYTTKNPFIIHNWTNTEFVKPMNKAENRFAVQHDLVNKFVVMYSGNWGLTHGLETIVQIAEILTDNNRIHFVLIGEGEKRPAIEQLVKEKKLKNILLLPYQDKETLPYSLSCADVGIITLGKGAENVSVPSKTYSTFAAGSVILALASENSELGLLIKKYQCGAVFSVENQGEAAEFINMLSKNREATEEYKKNARLASKDFTPENAKLYYREIQKN